MHPEYIPNKLEKELDLTIILVIEINIENIKYAFHDTSQVLLKRRQLKRLPFRELKWCVTIDISKCEGQIKSPVSSIHLSQRLERTWKTHYKKRKEKPDIQHKNEQSPVAKPTY